MCICWFSKQKISSHCTEWMKLRCIITNLHMFHSLSYSILSVVDRPCCIPIHVSTHCGQSKFSYAFSEMSYFRHFEKPETFGAPTECCGTPGQYFETHTTQKNGQYSSIRLRARLKNVLRKDDTFPDIRLGVFSSWYTDITYVCWDTYANLGRNI